MAHKTSTNLPGDGIIFTEVESNLRSGSIGGESNGKRSKGWGVSIVGKCGIPISWGVEDGWSLNIV